MSIRRCIVSVLLLIASLQSQAQQENAAIHNGNKYYKKGAFEKAVPEYQKAAEQNPENPIAQFNLGNARFRINQYDASQKAFEDAISKPGVADSLKQKAYYNQGVSLTKQKKLAESIEAYKTALRMNPADEDARFNLQKALSEQKQQQQKDNKDQKQQAQKKDQQKQQKDQQQKEQPQQQQSKLDKKQIEQYLKSLEQKEQEVQQKMQQNRARGLNRPDKDW